MKTNPNFRFLPTLVLTPFLAHAGLYGDLVTVYDMREQPAKALS